MYVRDISFLEGGKTLVACQAGGFLQFWDAATGQEQRTAQLRDPDRPQRDSLFCYRLQVSPDGKHVSTLERILSKEGATRLALWEIATRRPVRQRTFAGEVRAGAWSADGRAVVLPLEAGLTLIDLDSDVARFSIPGAASGPLAASPDRRLLAAPRTGAKPGEASVVAAWEVATGKEVASVAAGQVRFLAVAPDNRCLITTDERWLHVWDLATGKQRRRWPIPWAGIDSWGQTSVFSLLLSPNGRRAFTVLADETALVWDTGPALRPAEPLVRDPAAKQFTAWWADLANADARRAYAAVWRLAEAPPEQAVAFLGKHLRPVGDADLRKARALIKDLDSESFEAREKALKELQRLGEAAVPALREAVAKKPSLEVHRRLERLLARHQGLPPSPEILRTVRAIEVLERLGSAGARLVLTELAKGSPHADPTRHARASLDRLARRAVLRP